MWSIRVVAFSKKIVRKCSITKHWYFVCNFSKQSELISAFFVFIITFMPTTPLFAKTKNIAHFHLKISH